MINAIKETLTMVIYLIGLYSIFSSSNIIFGIVYSAETGRDFDLKKLFNGVFKSVAILSGVLLAAVGSTLVPILNEQLVALTQVQLMTDEFIEMLSTIVLYGAVVGGIGTQGSKAMGNVYKVFKAQEEGEGK
jgi:hypothetical protein